MQSTADGAAGGSQLHRALHWTTRVQLHRGWGCLSAQVAAPVMNRAGKRAWELVKRGMHQTGTDYIKGQLREELRGELSLEGLEAVRKHREGYTGASLSARVARLCWKRQEGVALGHAGAGRGCPRKHAKCEFMRREVAWVLP